MRKLALVAALGLAAVILVVCTVGWIAALPLIAVVTGGVLFNFWLGGRSTDAGDIAAGRPDERQAVIRLRAAELSGLGMVAAAQAAGSRPVTSDGAAGDECLVSAQPWSSHLA